MKLDEMFPRIALDEEIDAGYVRMRIHPQDDDLRILNYTEKAQFEKHWNEITLQTRGLIFDDLTDKVIARPFEKFFNVGEHGDGSLRMMARTEVTDKLDGSLGISYIAPDGLPAIATRGSFESEQAIHATELLRTKFASFRPVPGLTYLFEIIYPENRIVLDYGRRDTLVLLGGRIIHSGQEFGPEDGPRWGWEGPIARVFPYETLTQALAAPDRPNAEGLVVRYPDTGQRVKIKQEDYVRLHKLVTGLNERAVWEHLSQHDGRLDALIAAVPDEFHAWVAEVANHYRDRYEELSGRAHEAYHEILAELGYFAEDILADRELRRDFATEARRWGIVTPLLFQLLDGKDISPSIWKQLRPHGETSSLMNRTEDNS